MFGEVSNFFNSRNVRCLFNINSFNHHTPEKSSVDDLGNTSLSIVVPSLFFIVLVSPTLESYFYKHKRLVIFAVIIQNLSSVILNLPSQTKFPYACLYFGFIPCRIVILGGIGDLNSTVVTPLSTLVILIEPL